MKAYITTSLLVLAVSVTLVSDSFAQLIEDRTKLAQTGMQFLTVPLHARAAGLGDAMTALGGSSTALFYNPAGMAMITNTVDLSLGQNQWIGDIDYHFGSIAYRPGRGSLGIFGFSLMAINYGELYETIRADNTEGFEDLGTFSPTALAAGLGYARSLSDKFSVGGQLKYVHQSLGASTLSLDGDVPVKEENALGTLAVDFGVLYRTGFRSLNFAVSARNFSQELSYGEESYELPLSFRIGASMNLMDLVSPEMSGHALLLAVDAEHPRDYVEQLRVGLEYLFINTLALRVGYVTPTDEEGISLGAGLQQSVRGIDLGFDYAYTNFGIFGSVHRMALQFGLE